MTWPPIVLACLLAIPPAAARAQGFEREAAGVEARIQALGGLRQADAESRLWPIAEGQPPILVEDAVPAEIRSRMLEDLAFLGGIRGTQATPLHRQIFGAVDGRDYLRFFTSRIKRVGMGSCDPNAIACVRWLNGDYTRILLTSNYVRFKHPRMARLMALFHEARHAEPDNDFWSHALCPDPFLGDDGREVRSIWTGGPLAGDNACDLTPDGPYGVTAIMLKNIQKFCSNCSAEDLRDAGVYADDQAKRIVDSRAKTAIREDLYRSETNHRPEASGPID